MALKMCGREDDGFTNIVLHRQVPSAKQQHKTGLEDPQHVRIREDSNFERIAVLHPEIRACGYRLQFIVVTIPRQGHACQSRADLRQQDTQNAAAYVSICQPQSLTLADTVTPALWHIHGYPIALPTLKISKNAPTIELICTSGTRLTSRICASLPREQIMPGTEARAPAHPRTRNHPPFRSPARLPSSYPPSARARARAPFRRPTITDLLYAGPLRRIGGGAYYERESDCQQVTTRSCDAFIRHPEAISLEPFRNRHLVTPFPEFRIFCSNCPWTVAAVQPSAVNPVPRAGKMDNRASVGRRRIRIRLRSTTRKTRRSKRRSVLCASPVCTSAVCSGLRSLRRCQ